MAGANPNDWLCPNLGCMNAVKGVFAKHQSCPKCGAPKDSGPGQGGMGGMGAGMKGGGYGAPSSKPGDWLCPNPDCMNARKAVFAKHDSCPQCFAPREQGTPVTAAQRPSLGPGPQRQGDWMCPNPSCMNATKGVFGRHDSCPKCGATRQEGPLMGYGYVDKGGGKGIGAPPGPSRRQQWNMPSATPGPKAEDWLCPNMTCINATKGVFGRHPACPKCGCCKPGDWMCPNGQCINHSKMVFAKHTVCPKCGSAKLGTPAAHEQQMQAAMGYDMGYAGLAPGGLMLGPGPTGRMGSGALTDWRCPDPSCINNKRMVFGKHPNCPQCGAEKPAAPAQGGKGGKGLRSGDWKCPNSDCKNHRNGVFARHESCPACGMPKQDGLSEGGGDGLEDLVLGARSRSRSPRGSALY